MSLTFNAPLHERIRSCGVMIVPAAAALAIAMTTAAATADGMRGAQWGDDRDTVLAREGAEPLVSTQGLVVTHDRFAGMEVVTNHRFENGRLWQIRYFNRAMHRDPLEFLVDFARVKRVLIENWGEPDIDALYWHDDSMSDRPAYHHGQLVAAGALAYVAGWDTERARVVMTLRGEKDFRIAHRVILTEPQAVSEWPFGLTP